jgi:hypothetical protein
LFNRDRRAVLGNIRECSAVPESPLVGPKGEVLADGLRSKRVVVRKLHMFEQPFGAKVLGEADENPIA